MNLDLFKTLTPKQRKQYGKFVPAGVICDALGNELTFKSLDGNWSEHTYDANGRILTRKDSYGNWYERTFDANGYESSYKCSDGKWIECTRDTDGKELTFKNSSGVYRIQGKLVTQEQFEAVVNPTVKELTIAEIEELLGYPVKIVK